MNSCILRNPIQCHQCGNKIGDEQLANGCSNCGFSNEESLVQYCIALEEDNDQDKYK